MNLKIDVFIAQAEYVTPISCNNSLDWVGIVQASSQPGLCAFSGIAQSRF